MQRKTLTNKTTDHSTESGFSFSFFCDCCGNEWISRVQPFSGGACSTTESNEALKLLWASEHRAAFDEANLEAHFHFANCPQCGKWICQNCMGLNTVCKNCEIGSSEQRAGSREQSKSEGF